MTAAPEGVHIRTLATNKLEKGTGEATTMQFAKHRAQSSPAPQRGKYCTCTHAPMGKKVVVGPVVTHVGCPSKL